MISGQLISPGLIVPEGFSISLSKMTKLLQSQLKAFSVRDRLPEDCLHRKDKTFPTQALGVVSQASFCRRQICSFCQQNADCSVRLI